MTARRKSSSRRRVSPVRQLKKSVKTRKQKASNVDCAQTQIDIFLEESLLETFPASDPPSRTLTKIGPPR
jgi:hypothetical protein